MTPLPRFDQGPRLPGETAERAAVTAGRMRWEGKKGGRWVEKKMMCVYEGRGTGGLKGAKEMHSARLSVTACVNRESYFYPKPVRRSSPLARLPRFSLPPVHDTGIILHAVISLRRKRSQLSNAHHHFDPLIAESHFGAFIPTVSLALINVQLFQTRGSSPVFRPPFFLLLFCIRARPLLIIFSVFLPNISSVSKTPTLPCLSSSGSVIPSSINYS